MEECVGKWESGFGWCVVIGWCVLGGIEGL